MRLTCPSCSADYEVSPILLAGRQTVRCARCGHQWSSPVEEGRALVPLPAAEPPQPDPAPEPVAADDTWEDRRRPQPRRRRAGLWFAWVLTVVIIAAAVWAAVAFRAEVMRRWPPSTRAYAAVGLAAPAAPSPSHAAHGPAAPVRQ